MNLEDIQSEVAAEIALSVDLAPIPLVIDDGTYPHLKGIESGLSDYGMVLTIYRVQAINIVDTGMSGEADYLVGIYVIVEENVDVNRTKKSQAPILEVVRLLMTHLQGKLEESRPGTGLIPMSPPFEYFGEDGGIQRAVVCFTKQIPI